MSDITGLSLTLAAALVCLYSQKNRKPDVNPNNSEEAKLTAAALLFRSQKRRGLSSDELNISNHSTHRHRPPLPRVPSYELRHQSSDDNLATYGVIASRSNDSVANSGQALATLGFEQPLVIAMVGLPARGKSYLVKMITRYLKWIGFEAEVFNVGSYRRKMGLASAESNFFDSSNPEFKNVREQLAMKVQDEMYKWLHENETDSTKKRVAIFDATNTTKSRRLALAKRARQENTFLLFLESICDDENVLRRNYELKLQNDDYKGMDPDVARKDFLSRVKEYEKVYETVTDDEDTQTISYIKLINVGQKLITRNCYGYLPSQVAFYLQNVHINPRKIYLSYLAESIEKTFGEENLGGAESGQLTQNGSDFVQNVTSYLVQEQGSVVEQGKDILILTGTSNIHHNCVQPLREKGFKVFHTHLLNELRGGDLHGLSKEEIKILYPEEYEKRQGDKLHYRYPGVGGESYLDVIERVRPVIIELERQRRSIFIICHMAVLRCIYAYFMDLPQEELPFKDFDLHRVYELIPGPFGCSCAITNPSPSSSSAPPSSAAVGIAFDREHRM